MIEKFINPPSTLTVIIRDDSPFVHMQEPVRLRTVHIELTTEQIAKLRLRWIGRNCGEDMYESVAQCFLESGE